MRIGLIADTHMPGSRAQLWPQVYSAFQGVDYILHAGDLHTLDVVDRLCELAPTYVSIGNGDRGLQDERLRETWFLNLGEIKVGLIHRFPSPERKSHQHIATYIDRYFKDDVPQVMIYGHTHMETAAQVGDVLCVNPGSPTLPHNKSVRLGTIGYLDIDDGVVTASIHQITVEGIEPHKALSPRQTTFNGTPASRSSYG
ncbi:MAG: YfcE family phosphodiesterase [Pseudomonadales bacterium]|jgi:hypothetical protein|nr:YfcE family phosphodiesterase [Pseudomonadales bacterium]MDP7596901.1 YfcE family phosphodiesterase [Pseudomonadales bacterium]HJL53558.1 YfcE family phosphodiesterase [Arenicellales bacterium]HJN51726.1 YfcE family phosphodiesterase [Pseudomonadales bacterium]|tara:strand:- start:611 stop:1207 length:597 start_codon:yes stop_codon:yes gene_type:complete